MFRSTDTTWAPWRVIRSDDKKCARLNAIAHLLSQSPHEETPHERPVVPKRHKPYGYAVPDHPYKYVPGLE